MKNKRTIVLLVFAFFLVNYLFISQIKIHSIATDSGFDVGYSGGGSYGGSSSSSSSGGHASEMTLEDIFLLGILVILANTIFLAGHLIKRYRNKEKFKWKSQKIIVGIVATILFSLSTLILFFFIFYLPEKLPILLISLIYVMVWFVFLSTIIKCIGNIGKKKAILKENYLPLTEENKKILDRGYQIYLDVQEAWMNFDYEKMRTLVTDEMFQMYQSQLQTLSIKGERNIMSDFQFLSYQLVKKEREKITTFQILLKVSFYDYIVNESGKLVRGNKNIKVKMTYLLTFVLDEHSMGRCPHCNAELEIGSNKCSYCKSIIQGVSTTMKLSKKEVIKQE